MFKQGELLHVASQLKVDIPEIPAWYFQEYMDAHNIKELVGSAIHDVQVAFQTYHTTKAAMNLIGACETYEASLTDSDP